MSSGRLGDPGPVQTILKMDRTFGRIGITRNLRIAGIIRLIKGWQLGDSELVSQERGKSGTKKYPALGIFGGEREKSEGKGRFLD